MEDILKKELKITVETETEFLPDYIDFMVYTADV